MSNRNLKGNVLFFTAISSVVGTATTTASCTFEENTLPNTIMRDGSPDAVPLTFKRGNLPTFKDFGYSNLDNKMVEEQEERLKKMGIISKGFNMSDFNSFAEGEIQKLNDSRNWYQKLSYNYQKDSLTSGDAKEILTGYYNNRVIPESIDSMKNAAYDVGYSEGIGTTKQNNLGSKSLGSFSYKTNSTKLGFVDNIKNKAFGLLQNESVQRGGVIAACVAAAFWIYDNFFGTKNNTEEDEKDKKKYSKGKNFDFKFGEERKKDKVNYLKKDKKESKRRLTPNEEEDDEENSEKENRKNSDRHKNKNKGKNFLLEEDEEEDRINETATRKDYNESYSDNKDQYGKFKYIEDYDDDNKETEGIDEKDIDNEENLEYLEDDDNYKEIENKEKGSDNHANDYEDLEDLDDDDQNGEIESKIERKNK